MKVIKLYQPFFFFCNMNIYMFKKIETKELKIWVIISNKTYEKMPPNTHLRQIKLSVKCSTY